MRTKKLSLVVVPLLLTACSDDILQQDVYNHQYDCQQDWHLELCDEQQTTLSSDYTRYLGPQYYRTNRKVRYLGQVVKASGRRRNGPPIISTHINPDAKSTPIRGGFGGSGQSNSSGGG
ncbi:hypothetical protein I2F27_09210 [Acinetobacter sp. B5B]|uniref:hypothetical protein n=1 Tax=Acinetobacter baretiae TaxID=2605383 RepID=UPI0018C29068|nr:hypothetical protein [Acinetobacter baretiae]MBF7683498.1 hypothetical protein [Acinetobacter baretiae]MBF7684804.1 hypothetical protein [Acinetobacter baretiae]